MKFLDQARIHIASGAGGAGCMSFRREKFIEFGGPDGGDGGKGGDVIAECVEGLNTLIDYRYQQHFKAKTGTHGMGKNRAGAKGADAILKVPAGTQIYDEDDETLIADLTEVGQTVRLARGGNGGFGNAYFKTTTNQAPRRANPGLPGEERWVWLRLKLIADAGLVGLPNAGKSTFLARTTAAKPKIADYPFTTLHPGLGVVRADAREFVLADIPGLIEGAHEGHGLGDRFLGHVERCRVLLHLVDATSEHAGKTYKTVRAELEAYGNGLEDKPEIVALSKVSAAKPKIADYPFTTLHPQLGVVNADGREFVLADIPGLIEGAHEGAGLGDRFLGHVERCRVLLHLVDATCEHAGKAYKTVRHELEAYAENLADKIEIVALNKIDAITPEQLKEQKARLKRAAKKTPLLLSGVTREGVPEALRALVAAIGDAPVSANARKAMASAADAEPQQEPEPAGWSPLGR